MALFLRRSILQKFLTFVCLFVFVFVLVPASAQHPPGRVGGAPMPLPPPPLIHPPVYRAPIYQTPIHRSPLYRTPIYAPTYAPRLSAVSPARTSSAITVRPPWHPVRPFRPKVIFNPFPLFTTPFWPSDFCWWTICDQFWTSTLIYNSGPLDQWNPVNYAPPTPETPSVFGLEREDIPQLFLKDGTVLNVSDYWLVDGELHFMIVEQDGMKPTEQVMPFDELDVQKTVDENTKRGFRFLLRNEPFEQYVRDHPEGPPPALSPQ